MEFRINTDGELIFDDLALEYSDDYLTQAAYSRLVSISHDWYFDNIGADIETLFGNFITTSTEEKIKEKIYNAMFIDGIFNYNNLYVEIKNSDSLSYTICVYIKSIESGNSIKIKFKLDLFNGRLVM